MNKKEIQILYGDWATDNPRGYPVASSVFFSPDASLLAAHITPRRSIVWDVSSGERVIEFDNTQVFGFSHDGMMMVTSVSNYLIGVYDTATWKMVNSSMYISGSVISIKFTLDDELLIVLNRYGNITFWNWKTGKAIRTVHPSRPYTHPFVGQSLELSPDGTLLVHHSNKNVKEGNKEVIIDIWGVP